jgi:hypothetical protein
VRARAAARGVSGCPGWWHDADSLLSHFSLLTPLAAFAPASESTSTSHGQVGNCRLLEDLELSENALVKLPVSIGKLSALKRLSVQNNKLAALPPELNECISLEDIDVSNNPVAEQCCGGVPPSIQRDVPGILWLMTRHKVRRVCSSCARGVGMAPRHTAAQRPPADGGSLCPPPPPSARAQETRDQIAHLEDHNRLLEDREKDSVLRVEALNETIVQAEEKCKELEQTLKDTKKSCVIC